MGHAGACGRIHLQGRRAATGVASRRSQTHPNQIARVGNVWGPVRAPTRLIKF